MNRMTSVGFLALVAFTLSTADLQPNVIQGSVGTARTCAQHEDAFAIEVLDQLRAKIISKNAKLLMTILNGQCDAKQISHYNTYMSSVYSPALVTAVFREAIDNLYGSVKTEKLAAYFWSVYRLTDKPSYELMLRVQLQLFDKFISRGDINSQYLLNVGYYFYKVQHDALYQEVDPNLRNEVSHAIDKLPSTLLYFYFRSGFCLYNKGYQEYMYTADGMFYDNKRRYIFNWVPAGGGFAQGAWNPIFHKINNESAVNAGDTPFQVVFKGIRFGKFMYMDKQVQDMVTAWEPGTQPDNALWSVRFWQTENALALRIDEKVMCASENLYQYKERRFIHGMNNGTQTAENGNCQWLATRCP